MAAALGMRERMSIEHAMREMGKKRHTGEKMREGLAKLVFLLGEALCDRTQMSATLGRVYATSASVKSGAALAYRHPV